MPNSGAYFRRSAASRASKPDPAMVSNIEPVGERRELISLYMLLTNKKRPETRDAARLGDILLPWFEKSVLQATAKLEVMAELWQEHVAPAIVRHSRLMSFHRGVLTVALDSATVRTELETKLRSGLLRVLQIQSKGVLFRVKTAIQANSGAK